MENSRDFAKNSRKFQTVVEKGWEAKELKEFIEHLYGVWSEYGVY